MNLEKSRIKRPDYLKRWITETHEAKTKIVALEKPTNKGRGGWRGGGSTTYISYSDILKLKITNCETTHCTENVHSFPTFCVRKAAPSTENRERCVCTCHSSQLNISSRSEEKGAETSQFVRYWALHTLTCVF